jgi:NitT/TauT family transport system permease protein
MNSKSPLWIRIAAPIGVLFAVAIAWHLAVDWFKLPPILLPKPARVLQAIWTERVRLVQGAWVTLQASVLGLGASALIGSLVAILFSQSAWIRTALYPYVIFLQTVPIVAIAPLLIVWSGAEFRTVVLVSCIISIFPIISNVTSGLLSIDSNHLDLFRLQGASRWQTLLKLRIPSAMRALVQGLRISCGLAVIGAIVGELFVGNSGTSDGLGSLMNAMQANLRTAELIGAILACTLLGILLFLGVELLNRWAFRRWTIDTGFESAA